MDNTKILYHVDESEQVADVINGKVYKLPPHEPVEIPAFHANAILSHIGALHGIVEVRQVKTKTGVEWQLDEAHENAERYLMQCEKGIVSFYVRQQMEDRISGGKPALPPTGRALQVIQKRNINLRHQFGLVPVGWADPGESTPNMMHSVSPEQNQQIEALRQQNSELSATVDVLQASHADLMAKFTQFMEMMNPNKPSPAGQGGPPKNVAPDSFMSKSSKLEKVDKVDKIDKIDKAAG